MRRLLQRSLVPAWSLLAPVLLAVACADEDSIPNGAAGQSSAGDAGASNAGRGGLGAGGATAGNAGMIGVAGQVEEAGAGGVIGEAGMAGMAGGGGDPGPGDTYLLTSSNRLLFVNRASGAVVSSATVSGVASGETLVGMDVRPANGALYALTSAGKLYTVEPTTGAATLVATLDADPADATAPYTALSGTQFGVDFNPVANRLRVVSNTGQDLRINVDAATDNTTTDGALNPGTPSVTAAAYTNSFGAACRTRLYVLDSVSNKLLLQDPPNDGKLTEIGSLGLTLTAANGFEIATASSGANTGLIASAGKLYDVNLDTGATSDPRDLALESGESVIGLSALLAATAPAQALGELLGVTESNRLVSFNRAAPGKLCTTGPITGLAAGESVLGIDVRPATAELYALGSSAKLYTINTGSGAATLKSTLGADPTDATSPFTALSGTAYGIGFNPVPDRLRIISDSGQNLRLNVDSSTGTTTDAALNPGTPSLTALAYTNSFAGARSTTLFGLDTVADALVIVGSDPGVALSPAPAPLCPTDIGNPNCGLVTTVGALGIGDVTAVNGFDIDGKTGIAGSALAALSIGAATSSTLYSIDLATGAASLPPGVANATIGGGERLRGLVFAANPSVTVLGLSSENHVVRFAASTPNTLISDVAVTGLQANESLLGLDLRPADGKAYAVGSSGRLYTVDPITGVATLVGSLAAAVGDDNPFASLPAGSYGLDFNPVPDLLRVLNDADDNLRIVPSARTLNTVAQVSGATFTDTTLTPGTASVVAAAYTNSFAGATLTTLFGLDSSTDTLIRQGGPDGTPSPNTGVLTTVGALGVDVLGDAGFDIAGGRNGLSLAAIRTADSGISSRLYVINLATGAASAFPVSAGTPLIGNAGTTPLIRSLAIEVK